MAPRSDKHKRTGRPRGQSDKQAEVRALIEKGVSPLEAHQRVGYAQPYRAMKRNAVVVAQAAHRADPIATLKHIAQFGATADKIRACESLLMYAAEQKFTAAAPVVFVVDARTLRPEERRSRQCFVLPAQLDQALHAYDSIVASASESTSQDAEGFSAIDVLNTILVRDEARDMDLRAAAVALLRKHAAAPASDAPHCSFALPSNGRVPVAALLSKAILVTGEAHVNASAIMLQALDARRHTPGDQQHQVIGPQFDHAKDSAAKLAADKRPTEGQVVT